MRVLSALVLIVAACLQLSCAAPGDSGDVASGPARLARDEVQEAMLRLDPYYAGPDGLARERGLSLDGRPDFEGIAAWIADVYVTSRHAGLAPETAWQNVVASIEASDEWHVRHPGVTPSARFTPYRAPATVDRSELRAAMDRLDRFYASDAGLARGRGLSIDGRPDFEGVAAWIFDVYLAARLGGQGPEEAWDAVLAELERSEEVRRKHPPADASTLYGRHLMGYQGWFGAPGDGVNGSWGHWFAGGGPDAEHAMFDCWPDMSEYTPAERYATDMTLSSGARATLFSSENARTVDRHFRWMRETDVDGVSLGRFTVGTTGGPGTAALDQVLDNVRRAAERHERVFFVWYDVTGHDPRTLVRDVERDWMRLVDALRVTESSAYLRHRGRPFVGVWGIGAGDRPGTPEEWIEIIEFLKNAPDPRYRATVLAGGIPGWRDDPVWSPVFRRVDGVSPGAIGTVGDDAGADDYRRRVIEPDLAACATMGIDYLPIAFPGFSWANMHRGAAPLNSTPRRGGRFYWHQVHNIVAAGARSLFTAMFDELDEGTAMMKIAETRGDAPVQGQWVTLDADGERLPSDWYLRLGGAGARMLRHEAPLTDTIPIRP